MRVCGLCLCITNEVPSANHICMMIIHSVLDELEYWYIEVLFIIINKECIYGWVGVESMKGFTVYGLLVACFSLLCVCVCVHLCVTGSVESTDVLKVGQQIYWYLYMLYMQ